MPDANAHRRKPSPANSPMLLATAPPGTELVVAATSTPLLQPLPLAALIRFALEMALGDPAAAVAAVEAAAAAACSRTASLPAWLTSWTV